MGNATLFKFIFSKIIKKIQYLAFTDKVKIIKSYIPEKVKFFIEKNFLEELKYFQKKYSLKIELASDSNLLIPEYKIELLNKSKKVLNVIENIKKILEIKRGNKEEKKGEKNIKKIKKKQKKSSQKNNLELFGLEEKEN